ncbi:hypothetical protein KM864_18605 (plasmid) [Ralstonia solanacearum]|nr:hypothetical protein KM864_18605 [Ralstonia solanacearum]
MQSLKTMYFHVRPLLIAAAISLILAACNDHALDFRNAKFVNGKIYAAETDAPYSGKLVNVPSGLLLPPQVGFNKDVTNREIALQPLPPRPTHATGFIGFLTTADIQAAVLCDARVSNGYVEGNATCKARGTDDVRLEMAFKDSRLNGKLIAYAPETERRALAQVAFKDGELDNWIKEVLNRAEDLFGEKTGQRTLYAMFVNGRLDGEVMKYTPDGKQLIYKGLYAFGQPTDTERTYDPKTGRLTGQAEYLNGKLHGIVRRWNPDGKLVYERDYQDGQLIATSEAVQACIVSQLVSREKASSGLSRATLPMDEWDATCKEAPRATPDRHPGFQGRRLAETPGTP